MSNECHALAPPAGLIDVNMRPAESTATQRLVVGQDMPANQQNASVSDTVQSPIPMCDCFQDAAPPVGLVETITSPVVSPTTQNVALGHEMLVRMHGGGTSPTVHAQLVP